MSKAIKLIGILMFVVAGALAITSGGAALQLAIATGTFFAAWGVWFYGTIR